MSGQFAKTIVKREVKLKEMEGLGDVHLSAPAGAGKTFVAVQHVLEHLNTHPSARLWVLVKDFYLGYHNRYSKANSMVYGNFN